MRERTRELGLLIIGDVFCFIAALYITLAARYLALPSQELLRIHLIPFLIFTGLWILALLIASGTEAHELLHEINENNRFNYRIVHHIDPENSMRDVPGAPQLQKMISQKNVDLIIVNTSLLYAQHTLTLLYSDLAAQGLPPMRDFKTVYEETFDRVPLATVERDWITYHCADRDSLMYTVSKRLIDIVGSSILLLFFALLLPFIALAIKLDSKGPVFITQDRIGKNGRRLRVWKLRTMTQSESTSGLFFKENTTNVSRR